MRQIRPSDKKANEVGRFLRDHYTIVQIWRYNSDLEISYIIEAAFFTKRGAILWLKKIISSGFTFDVKILKVSTSSESETVVTHGGIHWSQLDACI